ncbi:uncharacterized protein C2orf81 homolog [Hyla sarda]|uniref:uncharacterized protein C2orf81 homolog n=1 Tax=Hyla sarda TaxID=327740 RepID=UPI0024C36D11|nr:uncharacterized protein C2orf81 homolog [Hyla sarda]
MGSRTGERARGGTSGQAMPRVAAPKSRGDKSRSVTVAPLPQVAIDIIPGRFTEDDWMSMVMAEDEEGVVGDLVDALMDRVMEECLMVHLQHQLIPYTVSQAREAMVQMVQWTFVARDEGDKEPDIGMSGQEEPQPCPHDSWAQGCVPVTKPASTPRYSQPQVLSPITDIPEEKEAPPAEEPPGEEEGRPVSPQEQIPTPRVEPDTSPPPTLQPIIQPTPPTAPPKSKPRYHPHRGPLRSAGVKEITKSLEETEREMLSEQLIREETFVDENVLILPTSLHNILKIQLGRPPQKKDVVYDQDGNVLSMPKVEISRLPQRHVRPRIEVLDVGRESEVSDVQRRGRQLPRRRSRVSSSSCEPPQITSQCTAIMDGPSRAPMSSAILLDTMPLTHGVILREGDMTERGSVYSLQKREHRTERRELRPIRASIPTPSLRVEQLIKNNIPQVQPLVSFLSH